MSTNAEQSILDLHHVTVTLGQRDVVSDASVAIAHGEIVGLIGPNGGGKSTLLKAVLGLIAYQGTITIAPGTTIGYVPQYFDFDRTIPLTVREWFRIRAGQPVTSTRADERIMQALTLVDARQTLKRRLGVLSGGELQRVLIASAIFNRPSLLILDEPSTGIDVGGEEIIYGYIAKLAEEKKRTIVFVSHDLDIVSKIATKALFINGSVTGYDTPDKVLKHHTVAHPKALQSHRHYHHP